MSKLVRNRPGTEEELLVNPSFVSGASQLPGILIPTTILSMVRGAAAACVDTECAPAQGWDNFANNLRSDLVTN